MHLTLGDDVWRPHGCPRCGLRWLAAPPTGLALQDLYRTGFYEQKPARAARILATLQRWNSRLRLRTLADMRPGTMLDIGSGKGHFLAAAREAGWDVTGIDLSAEAASYTRHRYGIDVTVGDIAELDLGDRFDVVTLWHVLEHLPRPGEQLERCHSLLRSGGRLVVSVPNGASLQARLSRAHWLHLDVPRHIFHFDGRSLAMLLAKHGFEVERKDTFYPEMEIVGLIQSLLNATGGERDIVYRFLKRDRTVTSRARVLMALALGIVLAPAAGAWSLIAPMLGTGASLQIVARPVEARPVPSSADDSARTDGARC